MLITAEGRRALLAFNRYWNKFGVEASGGNRACGARLRRESILVLLIARNFVMLSQHFGSFPHQHFRHGTEKAVAIHAIDQILIAKTISPTCFEIIRNP